MEEESARGQAHRVVISECVFGASKPKYTQEELDAAVLAEREACCRAVCSGCRMGADVQPLSATVWGNEPRWFHLEGRDITGICYADPIRRRW
jgi:hypothetical protein